MTSGTCSVSLASRFAAAAASAGVGRQACLATALSGGADSTALALLYAWWTRASMAPTAVEAAMQGHETVAPPKIPLELPLAQQAWHRAHGVPLPSSWSYVHTAPLQRQVSYAFIVDHNLRDGSADEARAAADVARHMGLLPHVITLQWKEGRPASGELMVRARDARYAAFKSACTQLGLDALLTGHHRDDQVETFLLRVSRCSGIDGLAAMPLVTYLPGDAIHDPVRLVRPLLHCSKSELEDFCRENKLAWSFDPTNVDPRFARSIVRKLVAREGLYGNSQTHGYGTGAKASVPDRGDHDGDDDQEGDDERGGDDEEGGHDDDGLVGCQAQGNSVEGNGLPILACSDMTRLTEDVLRLVDACREARGLTHARAAQLVRAAIIPYSQVEGPGVLQSLIRNTSKRNRRRENAVMASQVGATKDISGTSKGSLEGLKKARNGMHMQPRQGLGPGFKTQRNNSVTSLFLGAPEQKGDGVSDLLRPVQVGGVRDIVAGGAAPVSAVRDTHLWLDIRAFEGAGSGEGMRALQAIVQVVGGRGAMRVSTITRLWQMVKGGQLTAAFTCGGCTVRPVPQSRGCLALVSRD